MEELSRTIDSKANFEFRDFAWLRVIYEFLRNIWLSARPKLHSSPDNVTKLCDPSNGRKIYGFFHIYLCRNFPLNYFIQPR